MCIYILRITPRAEGMYLDLAGSIEFLQALLHPLRHRFLAFTDPDSGVVVLLVWLVLFRGVSVGFGKQEIYTYISIRVSDLLHEIVLVLEYVVTDTC